jgi:amino acid transporter
MSLWATKSVACLRAEADAAGERSLKRTLGVLNLTALGVGAIIGAGIFVLTGTAAALHAGPAVPVSMIVAVVVAIFTGLFPIQILGQLVNIGTLLAFVLVCGGVIVLRRTRPDLERPFRTPLVPLVPILGMLACFGLMATLPGDTWIRLAVWLVIGFAIYSSYGRHHSVLARERAAG